MLCDGPSALTIDLLLQILSSGIRIGFVTGPAELVNRINLHSQCSTLHVSGVSQLLTLALFKQWGARLPVLLSVACVPHGAVSGCLVVWLSGCRCRRQLHE